MKHLLIILLLTISFGVYAQQKEAKLEKYKLLKDLEEALGDNRVEDSKQIFENLKQLLGKPVEVKVVEGYTYQEPDDFADKWDLEKYFPLSKAVLTVWNDDLQNGNPQSSFIYKVNYDFYKIQNPINRDEADHLQMVPISVIKKMDVLTPQLIQFMDGEKICPKVMLRFYQDSKSGNVALRNQKYFRITMHDVKVAFVRNYTPEFKEFSQEEPLWYFEEVGFSAEKITWEDVKTGIKYTWDSKK